MHLHFNLIKMCLYAFKWASWFLNMYCHLKPLTSLKLDLFHIKFIKLDILHLKKNLKTIKSLEQKTFHLKCA